MISTPTIGAVQRFWEGHPCGSDRSNEADRRAFFDGVAAARYEEMEYLPGVGAFDAYASKRVLEIGCGLGTDGARFAAAGAAYTGVDLTEASIALARENFALRGLSGAFRVANAEQLPFGDASFDHVYSFGVIHHTPKPDKVVAEILRVLKPGGTVTVMLYNRTSINYYAEIMFLRRIGRQLLRPAWGPPVLARVVGVDRGKLEAHRRRMLGGGPLTREQWISMNTDGPDCPLSRVYSMNEARELLADFADFRTSVHFFDRGHWSVAGLAVPKSVAASVGRRWGWHRVCRGVKPVSTARSAAAQS